MRLILFFCSLILLVISCQSPPPKSESRLSTPPLVETAKAEYRNVSSPISRAGRLVPATEVKLSFKSGGLISEILAKEGQSVRRGQTLARLAKQEIEAQATQAKLALEQQEKDLKRLQALYADTVITLEQLEKAEAGVESRKAQIEAIEFNMNLSTIVAPTNGKILRRFAEPNELTGPGSPVFLFSPSRNQWHLNLQLSDKEGVRTAIGNRAEIKFDAFPDQAFPARVIKIKPIANPITGTFEIEVLLEELPKGELAAGLIGNATLFPADSAAYWTVPADALVTSSDKQAYVFELQGDSVLQRRLKIKRYQRDYLLIESGIEGPIEVVTSGKESLRSGQKVRLK
ncbi:MAG: efflux RND transporter periplasmic adaptor subunit [Bacteroidota bacterium]